jgi:Tfp pilus assembly protein PilF
MKYLPATLFAASALACSSAPSGPYRTPGDGDRDPAKAEQLAREGADLVKSEPTQAESLLRAALTADLFCGPAHNNLGVFFLRGGKLYEAAHEFEWARKLMPGVPSPRTNLALTLERAGHFQEALAAYDSALEVAPEHIVSIQGSARLRVRTGERNDRLRDMVRTVALRGESKEWREWGRAQLARLEAPSAPTR